MVKAMQQYAAQFCMWTQIFPRLAPTLAKVFRPHKGIIVAYGSAKDINVSYPWYMQTCQGIRNIPNSQNMMP
jgi:hypothetical protein